jgi:DNA mismatch repair protein MutL
MKKQTINILPLHVVNQIAAGEVIIRPSSIVKELIENSIDANSKSIDIFIKNGGKKSILVIDNGIGMSYEDAKICFLRYATSKINNIDDLFSISTKGFRGEALSAIASIAQIEISTKTQENELGTYLRIENNRIKEHSYISIPNGTSILVENIFYNIPVRRQFLKYDYIEFRHIINEFTKLALAHYELNFRLYNNSNCIFDLKSSSLITRINQLFGYNLTRHLIPIEFVSNTPVISITGFISYQNYSNKNDVNQFVFVNKRLVNNYDLYKSILYDLTFVFKELYYPDFFIFIYLNQKYIDINIHPNKSEIRFSKELDIYSIMRESIKCTLKQFKLNNDFNFFVNKNIINEPILNIPNYFDKEFYKENVLQILKKYIITYFSGNLVLIDQYRAHQRVLYEYFLNSLKLKKNIIGQNLIFPVKIQLDLNEISYIKKHKSDLLNLGIKLNFNLKYIYIESIPYGIRQDNIQNLFNEIINLQIINDKNEVAKLMAKSSSFTYGVYLKFNEILHLIKELFTCSNYYRTPFGELIFIKLTYDFIIKKFNK